MNDLGLDFWQEQKTFLFPKTSRPGLGPHPVSYAVDNGIFPLLVKLLQHEADYSPPPSAEIKNEWSYTSTPPIRHHNMGRDNFTFAFYH